MGRSLLSRELAAFDEVVELDQPGAATRNGFFKALRALADRNMSPDDVVVIYISTHGTLDRAADRDLHQYLVMSDTNFDDVPGTALDLAELTAACNSLTSRRKVLILATCHSGFGKSELPQDMQTELSHLKSGFFVKPVEAASEASVIIGVCAWGETAREDETLQNDIYTHFFLEGMGQYDLNDDGAVSLSEAHDYARRMTYYFTDGRQRPFARSDIMGVDPIILTGKVSRPGKPLVSSYAPELEGASVRINGQDKGQLPELFTVEPGWNHIQAVDSNGGSAINLGYVYVREGENLDLDQLLIERKAPRLGFLTSYRMLASGELSEQVAPGMPMYGLCYRVGAFPFFNTATLIEGTYGKIDWGTDLDSGYRADLEAQAYEVNLAWLFARRGDAGEIFAEPLVGVYAMDKKVKVADEEQRRFSSTVYPGLMGGMRLKLDRQVQLEVADRLSYQIFNVNDEMEGALANEISLTLYFDLPTANLNFAGGQTGCFLSAAGRF